MNLSAKQALIILGAAIVLYLAIRPVSDLSERVSLLPGNRKKILMKKPEIDEADLQDDTVRTAFQALCAYIDSYNAGEDEATLEKIKEEFKKKYGFIIYQDASLKLAVKDTDGNDILVNT